MKNFNVMALFAIAGLACSASAGVFDSSRGNQYQGGGDVTNTTYQYDDGISENSVGLTAGGTLGWMHVFQTGGDNQINSISLAWGTPTFPGSSGVNAGTPFNVFVWEDNDKNPANGATFLGSAAGKVSAGSIDTDILQSVAINATINQPFFWIGASVTHQAGFYPASLDQSVLSSGRAWVTVGDPQANFTGALEMDSIGLPGVWLLRADASGVPAPGAAGLLGLGGLLAARRRR